MTEYTLGFISFRRENGLLSICDIVETKPRHGRRFWRYMEREFRDGVVDEVRVFRAPHTAAGISAARVVLQREG